MCYICATLVEYRLVFHEKLRDDLACHTNITFSRNCLLPFSL